MKQNYLQFERLHYPEKPGFKAQETSAQAAVEMDVRSELLRNRIIMLICGGHTVTADEAAKILGESVLAIRPRFSELRAQGRIEDTGERRKNDSGKSAIVWRYREPYDYSAV